ncbi:MAG: hypothetical protein HQK60_09625 [Deltaproteobacteria bacterium]|nr:hypothetical protein [Deltaproteobacteria bacterium]
MKCPKCGFISFDYNENCPHCQRELASVGAAWTLPVMKPQTPFLLGALLDETSGDISAGPPDEPDYPPDEETDSRLLPFDEPDTDISLDQEEDDNNLSLTMDADEEMDEPELSFSEDEDQEFSEEKQVGLDLDEPGQTSSGEELSLFLEDEGADEMALENDLSVADDFDETGPKPARRKSVDETLMFTPGAAPKITVTPSSGAEEMDFDLNDDLDFGLEPEGGDLLIPAEAQPAPSHKVKAKTTSPIAVTQKVAASSTGFGDLELEIEGDLSQLDDLDIDFEENKK